MARHGLGVGILGLEMGNDLRVVLVAQPLERVNDPVSVVLTDVLHVLGDDRPDGAHAGTLSDDLDDPVHRRTQIRAAGPSSAFRSPNKAGDAVTRSESSSRMSTERPGWVSFT